MRQQCGPVSNYFENLFLVFHKLLVSELQLNCLQHHDKLSVIFFYPSYSASGYFIQSALLSSEVSNVCACVVASASSDRVKADDVGGSGSDRSEGEALGIVGTGASTQHNCTLCAGAITKEVNDCCCELLTLLT